MAHNDYYIYAYLRETDLSPYYIGKGRNNRAWDVQNHKRHGIFTPSHNRIFIMERGLTEIGAIALERFYIRWYGKKINDDGILHNKTDGGEGRPGYKLTEHQLKNFSKPKSKQHILKISEARSGTWTLYKRDGTHTTITNMDEFCRMNGLNRVCIHFLYKGKIKKHKDYCRVERIDK